jgi:glycosyltransferase involved in cell wall biosynthesis
MIKDNVTGILVPPKDSDALYNALRLIIDNTSLRKTLGRSGYSYAKDNYDIIKMKESIIKVYKDIMNE